MKLATKAAIGTASVVILTSLLILAITSELLSERLSAAAETRLIARVERELSVSARILDSARRDAQSLALGPVLKQFLEDGEGEEATARLRRNLGLVLSVRKEYRQMRYLDADGMEVARAERRADDVVIVPQGALQDKSDRGYFDTLEGMAPGTALAAQVSLNREFGRIEHPLRPTIRLLAPVHGDDGAFLGGVVLNMDASRVFPPRRTGDTEFRVVLPNGSYALSPDPRWEHGAELGTGLGIQREFDVTLDMPDLVEKAAFRLDGPGGTILTAQGWFVSDTHPKAARWRIMASQLETVALADMNATMTRMVRAVVLIAAMTSMIGIVAVHRTTQRAKALSQGARRVAAGNFGEPVAIDGNDELADTARAFNAMTTKIGDLIAREAEAREALSDLNEELLRSNRELESFARVTSHDLKTPLRPLTLLPDWIEEDLPDIPEEVRQHLDEMRRQAGRMTDLVDGLLNYSIAGSGDCQMAPVDIADLVETIIGTLGAGAAFRFDLNLPPGPIVAVGTEIDIVIRNLVQNAIKHHDRNAGRIGVSVRETGDTLIIAVSDDGPGIPEAYRDKVLEPLVTLRSRDDGGGSGLGLAIVSKIVRRWRGTIEVLPNEGRGTVIRITMRSAAGVMAA